MKNKKDINDLLLIVNQLKSETNSKSSDSRTIESLKSDNESSEK